MVDSFRSSSGRNVGATRRRALDPLLKPILWDLLVTTTGFALVVTAVVLAVQGASLN